MNTNTIKNLLGINYLYNETDARRTKRKKDRMIRESASQKTIYKNLYEFSVIAFSVIATIFLFMFIKFLTTPDVLENTVYKWWLICLTPATCFFPLGVLKLRETYRYHSNITKETIYTNAEKFFDFSRNNKSIDSVKIVVHDNLAKVILFYEDTDEMFGTITKYFVLNNFNIEQTSEVFEPLFDFNKNTYYLPI